MARKAKGTAAVQQWQSERKKQIEQSRKNNIDMQQASEQEQESNKNSTNPWQRVCSNVEFTA